MTSIVEQQNFAGKGVCDANVRYDQPGLKILRTLMNWLLVVPSVVAATSLHETSASET